MSGTHEEDTQSSVLARLARRGVRSIDDVVATQLCAGCGVCSYLSPQTYTMVDVADLGRRPRRSGAADADGTTLAACPGASLSAPPTNAAGLVAELAGAWGPVLDVFEAYSTDTELRRVGSSGGAVSAIALYCLEKGGMHGTLHIRAQPDAPFLNQTTMSRTRADLVEAASSRYSPSSPCEALAEIEKAPGPCVFVGKPCDVAATAAARRLRPALDAKIGLTIGIFCAGVPSTRGTLELLRKVGVPEGARILETRYRGNGWPGRWVVRYVAADGVERESGLSYAESWDFLQRYRQWRCHICPDHTGEFADVAVGDPWYRPIEPGEPGKSLVVARTPRGLEIVRAAVAAGYLVAERSDTSLLPRSQPNLLRGRGALWGRLFALRLARAPRPDYRGFQTFATWWKLLSLREKASSVLGTLKRVRSKRLRHRLDMARADSGGDGMRS